MLRGKIQVHLTDRLTGPYGGGRHDAVFFLYCFGAGTRGRR